jgi:hypothetical protein
MDMFAEATEVEIDKEPDALDRRPPIRGTAT